MFGEGETIVEESGRTPFITTRMAAEVLGLKPTTLEKMRRRGEGPPYRRHGRAIRYHVQELLAWSRETRKVPGRAA